MKANCYKDDAGEVVSWVCNDQFQTDRLIHDSIVRIA
jgi:hypothetical protein